MNSGPHPLCVLCGLCGYVNIGSGDSVELSDDAGLSRGGVNQALHDLDDAGLVLTKDLGVKRLYLISRQPPLDPNAKPRGSL